MLDTLAIIPCTNQKAAEPGPARDVWIGIHFQLTLLFAEEFFDRTLIMSFKYGLITPDEVIEPYDMNIHYEPLAVRVKWKRMMMQHIQREMSGEENPKPGIVGLFVGGADTDWLTKAFTGRGAKVIQPWKGLGTGQRQEAAYGGTNPFTVDGPDIREEADEQTVG